MATHPNSFTGIQRTYGTVTCPILSIKVKMSGFRGEQVFIMSYIAVGDVSDPYNSMVVLYYTLLCHPMTGSFNRNRFVYFPELSAKPCVELVR